MDFNFFKRLSPEQKEISFFVQHIFGKKPKNISLYEKAFVHKSFIEKNQDQNGSNERLEFLGDSILNSVVAEYFFKEFPSASEGYLTSLRAKVVSRKFLNQLARQFNVGDKIKKNIDHDLSRSSIFGNTLEALIGAFYLDFGYEKTKKALIERLIMPYVTLKDLQENIKSNKSLILEWCQANQIDHQYKTEELEGQLANNKRFVAILEIQGVGAFSGEGPSKKAAEVEAAGLAWKQING